VVGAAVDHHGVGRQLRGDLRAGPVGQGEEHDIVPAQSIRGGGLQDTVGERMQVRLVIAQRRAGTGGGGERADLELGVAQQDSQQFTPGVSAGSGNGDRGSHDA
jgi:hypothetical protein